MEDEMERDPPDGFNWGNCFSKRSAARPWGPGKSAVPFFIQALHETDLPDQWQAPATDALGEIVPTANGAIPVLLQMTNKVFEYLQGCGDQAQGQIDRRLDPGAE